MIGEDNYEYLLKKINAWKAKEEYKNETQYRDDLIGFLRMNSKQKNNFSLILDNSPNLTFIKESGRTLADIAVGKEIGIEMKKDLKKQADIDRLIGQLNRHRGEYRDIIIVLVGETSEEALEKLKIERNRLLANNSISLIGNSQRMGIIKK